MKITIKNWDTYQPRKDLKVLNWFRLDSDIAASQSLFGLNPAQKWLFVWLVAHSAKKNSASHNVELSYVSHFSGLSEAEVEVGLAKLQENQLIELDPYRSVQIRTNACPTNNTLHNITLHNNTNIHIPVAEKKATKTTEKSVGTYVWLAYAIAYASKYKSEPIRNAKTNSICKKLVEFVGKEKAVQIVSYYLTINDAWYLKNYHKLEFCLTDYQKILTSLETGLNITSTRANQVDQMQTNRDAFKEVKKLYEEGKIYGRKDKKV